MSKKGSPERISKIMEEVLSKRGYLTLCRESQIREKWREIVGDRIANMTDCRGVEEGVLYVRVPSAAWRQEVSFTKEEILQQIRKHTQCETVSGIVFC